VWWKISVVVHDNDDTEKPHGAASSVDQADSIPKPKEPHASSHHSI